MGALAQPLIVCPSAHVHTEAGGERRKGRVGTGEACRHNAHHKQHLSHWPKRSTGREHEHHVVAFSGQGHTHLARQQHQQHAKSKQKQVDGKESKAIGAHVFLRVTKRLAGEILLHHILIQARHHDNHEHAGKKLLEEVLRTGHIREDKYARMAVGCDGTDSLGH